MCFPGNRPHRSDGDSCGEVGERKDHQPLLVFAGLGPLLLSWEGPGGEQLCGYPAKPLQLNRPCGGGLGDVCIGGVPCDFMEQSDL